MYLGFGIWDLGSWEPKEALLGGVDGFGAYHKIASSLRVHSEIIKPKGFLVLEIGKGQGKKVKEIFQQCSDLQYQRSGYDLQKLERCLVFQRTNRNPSIFQ